MPQDVEQNISAYGRHLKGQIQDHRARCRISSRYYVCAHAKMVSNDSWPSWAAYTTMISDLGFDIQGQTQGQFTGTGYRLGITSAHVPEWSHTMASLPGQHIQP